MIDAKEPVESTGRSACIPDDRIAPDGDSHAGWHDIAGSLYADCSFTFPFQEQVKKARTESLKFTAKWVEIKSRKRLKVGKSSETEPDFLSNRRLTTS
jgi:hypothetical protein